MLHRTHQWQKQQDYKENKSLEWAATRHNKERIPPEHLWNNWSDYKNAQANLSLHTPEDLFSPEFCTKYIIRGPPPAKGWLWGISRHRRPRSNVLGPDCSDVQIDLGTRRPPMIEDRIFLRCVIYISPDSEWLGAAVVAAVGSSLSQPSGISYFSLYSFFWSTCVSNDPGPEFFVVVCLNLK